jgi:hypothetical protein
LPLYCPGSNRPWWNIHRCPYTARCTSQLRLSKYSPGGCGMQSGWRRCHLCVIIGWNIHFVLLLWWQKFVVIFLTILINFLAISGDSWHFSGGPPNIVSHQLLFILWVKTPCKISEPYDDHFWEKSNPIRKSAEREKTPLIVDT